mgnify:CR=1 FL=1
MNKFTYENTPLGKIAYGYVEEVGAVEPRNTYNQKIAGGEYRQENDHGGHLIAHSLQGSSGLENIDPQNKNVNQIDQRHIEREVASCALDLNNNGFYGVTNYTPVGERPQAIMINYSATNKLTGEQIDEPVSFQSENHELEESWDV